MPFKKKQDHAYITNSDLLKIAEFKAKTRRHDNRFEQLYMLTVRLRYHLKTQFFNLPRDDYYADMPAVSKNEIDSLVRGNERLVSAALFELWLDLFLYAYSNCAAYARKADDGVHSAGLNYHGRPVLVHAWNVPGPQLANSYREAARSIVIPAHQTAGEYLWSGLEPNSQALMWLSAGADAKTYPLHDILAILCYHRGFDIFSHYGKAYDELQKASEQAETEALE